MFIWTDACIHVGTLVRNLVMRVCRCMHFKHCRLYGLDQPQFKRRRPALSVYKFMETIAEVVLCLSVTKWVHFAHGDTGILGHSSDCDAVARFPCNYLKLTIPITLPPTPYCNLRTIWLLLQNMVPFGVLILRRPMLVGAPRSDHMQPRIHNLFKRCFKRTRLVGLGLRA